MTQLNVGSISVRYGRRDESVEALKDFTLEVASGQMTVLLGPSGCGKSTALNAVAGVVAPTSGRITIGGRVVFSAESPRVNLPPDKRQLGMVFQSYSLWPHLTAVRNVEYPLRMRGEPRDVRRRLAQQALESVKCGNLADRYPAELSGGQQQRVAFARAVVAETDVILFDEPLSNLDTRLRQELREQLQDLHQRLGFGGIYVTHDKAEALALADTIVVMNAGHIEQHGSPQDVHDAPVNDYVARFMGANVVPAQRDHDVVRSPVGTWTATPSADSVAVAFYPNECTLAADPQGQATIRLRQFAGSHWDYVLDVDGHRVEVSGKERLDVGSRVTLEIEPAKARILKATGMTPGSGDADPIVDGDDPADAPLPPASATRPS